MNVHHDNCCHPLDKKSPVPINHRRSSLSNVGDTEIVVRYCTIISLNSKKQFDGCLFVTFLHYHYQKPNITIDQYISALEREKFHGYEDRKEIDIW